MLTPCVNLYGYDAGEQTLCFYSYLMSVINSIMSHKPIPMTYKWCREDYVVNLDGTNYILLST